MPLNGLEIMPRNVSDFYWVGPEIMPRDAFDCIWVGPERLLGGFPLLVVWK